MDRFQGGAPDLGTAAGAGICRHSQPAFAFDDRTGGKDGHLMSSAAKISGHGMIDFYFDFISPFSYLAHQRLPQLAARYGYSLHYHVADLAALKRLCGNTAPRMVDMPLKLEYSRIDQRRWAERYGVPITPPAGSHDSSWVNRGGFFSAAKKKEADLFV